MRTLTELTKYYDRNNPKGLNHLTPLQQTELDNANQLVERSIEIAQAITKNGGLEVASSLKTQ